MKPFFALLILALSGIATGDQYAQEGNYAEPQYYQEPLQQTYQNPAAKIKAKNDLIDRQLEAFVAGPLATLVAVTLAGAVIGGFANSAAENGRMDLQEQITMADAELHTLHMEQESSQMRIGPVCSQILQKAFISTTRLDRRYADLPETTPDEIAFKAAYKRMRKVIKQYLRVKKDNRCNSADSSS